MKACFCGKKFASQLALAQHQADKGPQHAKPNASGSQAPVKKKARDPFSYRDKWMWDGAKERTPIRSIQLSKVEPSGALVSSSSGCDLVSAYNWQCLDSGQVPGAAPIWQPLPLPVTLPWDKENWHGRKSHPRIPEYPFEPLFEVVAAMNPGLVFNDVDVIVNRNSLRKLLDLCHGRRVVDFRLDLCMIQNTLFIERCERNPANLCYGFPSNGVGHSFEHAFTKLPTGQENRAAHHRALQYKLGDLNCVIQCEVDALYGKSLTHGDIKGDQDAANITSAQLASMTTGLSIQDLESSSFTYKPLTPTIRDEGLMHQSLAAEIKTSTRQKDTNKYMPQLWFGRTPWLIRATHKQGTFHTIQITNCGQGFGEWEEKNQGALQKLVTILKELRDAVKKNGGDSCIAIFHKAKEPTTIEIFAMRKPKDALSRPWVKLFWEADGGREST